MKIYVRMIIIALLGSILLIWTVGFQSSYAGTIKLAPTPIMVQPTLFPGVSTESCEYKVLESRIDSIQDYVNLQSETYSSTISRWESNLNFILVILGAVGLVVALLGFGFVKDLINRSVAERLKEISQTQIEKAIEQEVLAIRNKWDPKFAELYEEYRKRKNNNE